MESSGLSNPPLPLPSRAGPTGAAARDSIYAKVSESTDASSVSRSSRVQGSSPLIGPDVKQRSDWQ